MPPKSVREKVHALLEPVLMENGIELVELEFVKEGTDWYLRIYIDQENGVDLDDCQKISHLVSDILDREDPIEQAYFLEVSSPGIERPLKKEKDFRKYEGHLVDVRTFTAIEGKKKIRGRLGVYTHEALILMIEQKKEIRIPWELISQVKLGWEEEEERRNK